MQNKQDKGEGWADLNHSDGCQLENENLYLVYFSRCPTHEPIETDEE